MPYHSEILSRAVHLKCSHFMNKQLPVQFASVIFKKIIPILDIRKKKINEKFWSIRSGSY